MHYTKGFLGQVCRTIKNGDHYAKHGVRCGAEQMFR